MFSKVRLNHRISGTWRLGSRCSSIFKVNSASSISTSIRSTTFKFNAVCEKQSDTLRSERTACGNPAYGLCIPTMHLPILNIAKSNDFICIYLNEKNLKSAWLQEVKAISTIELVKFFQKSKEALA